MLSLGLSQISVVDLKNFKISSVMPSSMGEVVQKDVERLKQEVDFFIRKPFLCVKTFLCQVLDNKPAWMDSFDP
jgi:hypothetical protein